MTDLARQTRAAQQGKSIQAMLTPGAQGALRAALADRIGLERFMQAAVTSFQSSAKLRACSEDSIVGALFISAQLGLEVGGPRGLAYLVPYGREATFVLGYRGLLELFHRTGQVSKVDAFLIREGDVFQKRWDPQIGRTFTWEPGPEDAEPVGVVAYVITKLGGPPIWVHMTREQIEKRRPPKWTGGPWETWRDEMWLKTGLKGLGRFVRQSTDDQSLLAAITADETIRHGLPAPGETTQQAITRPPLATPAARPAAGPPPAHDTFMGQPALGHGDRPPAAAAPPPDPEPVPEPEPELDPEAAYEQMSDEEYQAWLDSQGPV